MTLSTSLFTMALPTLKIASPVLRSLHAFSKLPYEVTGYIQFDDSGRVSKITVDYDDMTLDRDPPGYDVVFHSHPNDYKTLFPDHPSVTDIETTHFLVCTTRETQAHLVATPKYLFVIAPLCTTFLPTSDAEKTFNSCSSSFSDRNSEEFRNCWLAGLLTNNVSKVTRIPWDRIPETLFIEARFTPVHPFLKYLPIALGSLVVAAALYALISSPRK